MMRHSLVALVTGALFALGLAVSGMTDPAKVIAFLDVFGAWDPSLALVMAAAVAVHVPGYLWARQGRGQPVLARRFELPTSNKVDARLITGAALFGLGWGAAGFCPGPAVVSAVTGAPSTLLFLGAMLAGMGLHSLFERRQRQVREREASGSAEKDSVVLSR